jgi:hypothetical protein
MFVKLYKSEKEKLWDQFVRNCRNSHFFFFRNYLEYHNDRFEDFSLMVYDENETIVCLLPANKVNDQIISHGGLTFGGLLVDDKTTTNKTLLAMEAILAFLKENQIVEFIYKPIPFIYSKKTAQEDLNALFRNDAELTRRDVCSTIDYSSPIKYSKGRKWSVKKAKQDETIEITTNDDFAEFWDLLNEVLGSRHGVQAVHSLEEINLLYSRFPKNIKLIAGKVEGKIQSGALIFETDTVAHVQYMASSFEGKENYVLDKVIDFAIEHYKDKKRYFSFGISNENEGKELNRGLISQKEGFGAKSIVHEYYKINIK